MSASIELITAAVNSLNIKGGVVPALSCKQLCEKFEISVENLMIALLPVASRFAKNSISNFAVGAVVKGECGTGDLLDDSLDGYANLYLGTNIEFENQALCHTIHAEQSAIAIAWINGETRVNSIATSAVPCGHCRQFIYELSGGSPLPILTPNFSSTVPFSYDAKDITQVLPDAFGPADLNCHRRFMEEVNECGSLFVAGADTNDRLIQRAMLSAENSYSPYTKNFAGCAVLFENGNILSASCIENVAFNPSLIAFSIVVIQLVMNDPMENSLINLFKKAGRVVLIEKTNKTSQKNLTSLLLSSYRPDLKLEYYLATKQVIKDTSIK